MPRLETHLTSIRSPWLISLSTSDARGMAYDMTASVDDPDTFRNSQHADHSAVFRRVGGEGAHLDGRARRWDDGGTYGEWYRCFEDIFRVALAHDE